MALKLPSTLYITLTSTPVSNYKKKYKKQGIAKKKTLDSLCLCMKSYSVFKRRLGEVPGIPLHISQAIKKRNTKQTNKQKKKHAIAN